MLIFLKYVNKIQTTTLLAYVYILTIPRLQSSSEPVFFRDILKLQMHSKFKRGSSFVFISQKNLVSFLPFSKYSIHQVHNFRFLFTFFRQVNEFPQKQPNYTVVPVYNLNGTCR